MPEFSNGSHPAQPVGEPRNAGRIGVGHVLGFPIVSAYFFTLASKARYIRRLQARFMIDHIRQAPGKLSFTSSEAMDGIQHYSSKAAIIAEYNVFIFNAMR
jgi:hypothetical protein